MSNSDPRNPAKPVLTKRRSRRLSGPGRMALHDLSLILFILASDLEPKAGGALRQNINEWKRMYLDGK